VFGFDLQVMNINTGQSSYSKLDQEFGDCWMFCLVHEQVVLGVEAKRAIELNLISFKTTTVGELNIERRWPGMALLEEFIYAFGGNVTPAISSCEKYNIKSKTWSRIGDMHAAKSCFTPCWVQSEIFLCCFHTKGSPFEAFNPATETFRCLPVGYQSSLNGSVAFLVEDTIYIVAYEKILVKWKLAKQELEPSVKINLSSAKDLGSSNIPPVQIGKQVFWVCYSSGELVTFDLTNEAVASKSFFNKTE
jgi:hypothetical protein